MIQWQKKLTQHRSVSSAVWMIIDRSTTAGPYPYERVMYLKDEALRSSISLSGRRTAKQIEFCQMKTLTIYRNNNYTAIGMTKTLSKSTVWQPVASGDLDVVLWYRDGSTIYTLLSDGNKNTRQLKTTAGTVAATYDYDPFGNVIATTGTVLNPWKFSSEYHDSETGLVYYNYRDYAPSLGRWISRDPIEENGEVNLYVWAGNNCLKKVDAWGLMASSSPSSTAPEEVIPRNRFFDEYLNYDDYKTTEAWQKVNGHMFGYHLEDTNGAFENSCALRVSASLVNNGITINKGKRFKNDNYKINKTVSKGGVTVTKGTILVGDNNNYIISARVMNEFLRHTFGNPTYIWSSKSEAEKYQDEIENCKKTAFFAGNKHVGMIRKNYKDPYFPYDEKGNIWVVL